MFDPRMKAQNLALDDFERDSMYLKALSSAEDIADIEGMAIEKALASHPITPYVLDLDFEDPVTTFHSLTIPAISDEYLSQKGFSNSYPILNRAETPYLVWSLPGRDKEAPKRNACGIFRSALNKMFITACSNNKKDYAQGKSMHCWSMRCPNCMNSASLRRGAKAETRILARHDIEVRKTGKGKGPIHITFSPPQDIGIWAMQTADLFKEYYEMCVFLLKKYGVHSGAVIFHPWRLNGDPKKGIPATKWELGPHFHIVGYADFVDYNQLHKDLGDDWILKVIHYGEEIRSVRQTVAYLLTHAGLCWYDRPNINFDLAAEDILIPPTTEKNHIVAKDIPTHEYESDWKETGLYAEHLDQFDFVDWTIDKHKGYFQTLRYYGDIRRANIRTFATYTEKRQRRCPECDAPMMIYHGVDDMSPTPAEYSHESVIRVMADDIEYVEEKYAKFSEGLFKEGHTALDFALAVPHCSTPESQGVAEHKPKRSTGERADRRNHTIVYVPHPSGHGFKAMRVTRQEAKRMKEEGLIA